MILRDYQQEILDLMFNIEKGSWLIQLPTGCGKCFAKDTKILMYDGTIKNVQDIKKDDLIMGDDSTKRKVLSTTNGKELMYEIIQNKKQNYIVNESHILSLKCTTISNTKVKYVYDVNRNKYTNGDVCNISVKDYLKCSKTFKHVMKGYSVPIEFKEKQLKVDSYFLGIWLGDGINKSLSICTRDIEIVNYLNEFSSLNNFNIRKDDYVNNKSSTYHLTSNWKKSEIRKYMKDNLFNNKHIPKEYLINNRENRLKLLAGLLDTDGHLLKTDNSTFEFITQYKQLSEDVMFLTNSLGLSCSVSLKYNKKYDKNYFRLFISGDTSIIPIKITYKKPKKGHFKNNLLNKINVIKKEINTYYGFEIDGNRLFCLSDFTVVHNTVIFTEFINKTNYRVLLLSHREELVNQPIKYILKPVGIEMGKIISNGETIISTCVPSMIKRLDKFPSDYFDVIITDECHHSASKSYKQIYNHFKSKFHFGFTATPNRNDGIRLNDIFQKIIYKANLLDMIKKGYLCDIKCTRSFIDFDLTSVKKQGGDFKLDQLDQAMNDTSKAIAKIAIEKSVGQTLIFGVSVKHCEEIQKHLPNSVLVTASTKNRDKIIEDFTNRKFKYLINCMIFTEGTDIPLVETLIIARPTLNESLWIQMVGRGLRLCEGKTHLNLIDCVGVSSLPLITAPSLLGLKLKEQKEAKEDEFENISLFDLESVIEKKEDNINVWKINYKTVDIWRKQMKYNLYNINFYKCTNGDLTLKLPNTKIIRIKHPDELGKSNNGVDFQELIDKCFEWLQKNHEKTEYIWNLKIMKRWGSKPATDKQKELIKKIYGEIPNSLTKLEASQILNRRV